jgi:formylmethanofuran dehydrogenase subunit E
MSRLTTIGTVKSSFTEPGDPFEMRKKESSIIIDNEFKEGLYRLGESKYIQVIYGFHLFTDYTLKGPTYFDEVKGVFASRSPRRPSPLGVTTVKLLRIKGNRLDVKGLDAVDGSPVYDIKPHAAVFDEEESRKGKEEWLKRNPRAALLPLIKTMDFSACLEKAGRLHGHFCPGLALGVMAAIEGLNRLHGHSMDGMEGLMAIVETNNCFSDGIQMISGCTFGNNALVFRDMGKTAVTLAERKGKALRLSVTPFYKEIIDKKFPDYMPLFDRAVKYRKASEKEISAFKKMSCEASFFLIKQPPEKVFKIEEVKPDIPGYAPIFDSASCLKCGEEVMMTRAVKEGENYLCLSCAGEKFYQLQGEGIVVIE